MNEARFGIAAALAVSVFCWQGMRLVGSFREMQNWRHSPSPYFVDNECIKEREDNPLVPLTVPMPDTSGVFEQYEIDEAEMFVAPDRCGTLFVYDHAKWVTVRVMKRQFPDQGSSPCTNQVICWETGRLRGTCMTDAEGFCRVLISDSRCDVTVPRYGSRSYSVELSGNHKVTVVNYF